MRRDLISVAARIARHGRGQITLHLPQDWHRETEWVGGCSKPPAAHPPCGPDQPGPGHRIPQITSTTPAGHPAIPGTDPWTSRRNVNDR